MQCHKGLFEWVTQSLEDKTGLSNYPFPSQIYLLEMHSLYTQNTQMFGSWFVTSV